MATVNEIILEYMDANGFSAIVNTDRECGCDGPSECPYEGIGIDCEPGHRVPCVPETCETGCWGDGDSSNWCYTTKKPDLGELAPTGEEWIG